MHLESSWADYCSGSTKEHNSAVCAVCSDGGSVCMCVVGLLMQVTCLSVMPYC